MPQVARQRHGPCSLLPGRLRLQTREAFHLPQQQTAPSLSVVGVIVVRYGYLEAACACSCSGIDPRKSMDPLGPVSNIRVEAMHLMVGAYKIRSSKLSFNSPACQEFAFIPETSVILL